MRRVYRTIRLVQKLARTKEHRIQLRIFLNTKKLEIKKPYFLFFFGLAFFAFLDAAFFFTAILPSFLENIYITNIIKKMITPLKKIPHIKSKLIKYKIFTSLVKLFFINLIFSPKFYNRAQMNADQKGFFVCCFYLLTALASLLSILTVQPFFNSANQLMRSIFAP